jgi:peptidoglycan-associated lipoprotein
MNIKFSHLFVFSFLLFLLTGCAAFHLRVAENYYEEFAYSKAIPKYEKVLRKSYDPAAASKLADAYRKTGNSYKAEIWYRRLANSQYIKLADKLNFAEVLMENGKYEEAKVWFSDYLALNISDKRVKRLAQACDSIHLFFEDTTVYDVKLSGLNKQLESNFSPTYFRDGIVFLSDRPAPGKKRDRSTWTGREYLDLFFSRKNSDSWTEPELLRGDINGLYDEGPASFTPNNSEVYFTRTDYSGKTIEKNEKNISTLKLHHAKLVNNKWVMQPLPAFNSRDYSVGHPSISPDGNTLYFVSDMPWGYGGTDIYRVTWRDGKWSDPENLGPQINSEGNERFPFIASDSVLYFASDGYVGLGGLDIYSSFWNGEQWSTPENLQYPVNSSKDDFGFIIDPNTNTGFFSSNRIKNLDMLFEFRKNPPEFSFQVNVSEEKTGKPVNIFETFLINRKGESIPSGVGSKGKYSLKLQANTNYQLKLKSFGYYAVYTQFSTIGKRKSETIIHNLEMSKIELNKAVRWNSIQFLRKETELSESTTKALDSLQVILEDNPEMQIEIISHTDSRGSYSDNMSLSRIRAEKVANYLIGKGISNSRIIPIGMGEAKLLNNCRDGILCLEEDHQVNNRIEIRVISLVRQSR